MSADASRLIAGLERWAGQTHSRAVEDVPQLIRQSGDVPRKDGELAAAIRSTPSLRAGSRFVARALAPVIQAATTDKGARPHVIVPRRPGGVLVFHWPKAGGTVYLRRVHHPGNPPRPWWRKAVTDAYQRALRDAARSTPFR